MRENPTNQLLSVLAGFLLCAAGPAQLPPQPKIVWHNDSGTAGSGNAFPWCADGIRYQSIVSNALMGNVPALITEIFLCTPTIYLTNEILLGDVEIKMGVTTQATPIGSWTANNPNPTVVYRGPLRIRFKPGQWSGIGLPNTYLWQPLSTSDNLCIEVIVWQVLDKGYYSTGQNFFYPTSGTAPRAFVTSWVQGGGYANAATPTTGTSGCKMGLLVSDGYVVDVGTGCKGSTQTALAIGPDAGKWPRQGQPFNLNLSGAATGPQPAFVMLGISESTWNGIPLPLDLAILNAPGCKAWHDVLLSFGTVTGATGSATFPLSLPALTGLRLKASFAVLDPQANAFGLVTSNFLKLFVGP